jgi:hypothetical protein
VLVVVVLVSLGTYLLAGLQGKLLRDPAVYVYAGQLVANGAFPYEDLLNRTGPLAQVVPALGVLAARALDLDDVVTVRALFLVISVACVALTYVLGSDLFRSRAAGLAAAATLLVMHPFLAAAAQGPREKTLMVLFLLSALLAVSRQRWATSGTLVALGTLTWQPMFFCAIVGVVVAVLLGGGSKRLHALVRVAVGGAVPTLLVVTGFALGGHLRTAIESFLVISFRYTAASSSPLGQLGNAWAKVEMGYGWTVWVLWAGVLAVVLAGGLTLGTDRRHSRRGAALVGVAASVVAGLVWTLRAFDSYPDTFLLLPGSVVGIGAVSALAVRRLPGRLGVVTVVTWTLVVTSLAAVHALQARDHQLLDQRRLMSTVLATLPSGARVGALSGPQALVLSGSTNPSRYLFYAHGVGDHIEDTWPGGMGAYVNWFVRQDVELIAVSGRPSKFRKPLKREYVRVGNAASLLWFVDRDLGRDVQEAARRAVHGYAMDLA